MKLFRCLLILFVCSLSIPAFSQGVAIYKKDGTVVKFAYEEVDSIVTYNYDEELEEPLVPTPQHKYEYVDLGLSVKWATCNVGATKPEEYGDYYAWGETDVKEDYLLLTYKWCNIDDNTLTKYCMDSNYGTDGFADNKIVLDPKDDIASVKWGGDWRMPTAAEFDELIKNCVWEWSTLNGVNGYKVTASNGNSIFLPAAGNLIGTYLIGIYEYGYYWSRSLSDGYDYSDYSAYSLVFYENFYERSGFADRYSGRSVRPVLVDNNVPEVAYNVSVSSNSGGSATILGCSEAIKEFTAGSPVTVTATPDEGYIFIGWFVGDQETPVSTEETYEFTVNEDITFVAKFEEEIIVCEAVDLGLSVKWATCNVGATKPEEYGEYYAWGEIDVKEDYVWLTYKWCNGSENALTKYCLDENYGADGFVDNKMLLDSKDDIASVKLGDDWRMPTAAELDELIKNCDWEWSTLNGVNGYKVIASNGNSIFLPAAGYCYGEEVLLVGLNGWYWSLSLCENGGIWANDLRFGENQFYLYDSYRLFGHTVRPVLK